MIDGWEEGLGPSGLAPPGLGPSGLAGPSIHPVFNLWTI